jgi:chromosome segregation ATPase
MKRTVARAIAVGTFLFVTVSLLALSGCTDGDAEDARKEAREAKKKVSTLELSLARAQQQITDLKEELNVVRETRDELQRQVDQLGPELDKARLVAGEAEQIITHLSTRAEGQNTATAALEKEMAELKALVADQAALIEELQNVAAEEPIPTDVSLEDEPAVVDPNADL